MSINKSTAHDRDFNKATRESFETHEPNQSESCGCDRCRLNLPWPARCVRFGGDYGEGPGGATERTDEESEGVLLIYQCPGCWGTTYVPAGSGDGWWECDCGEKLTCVDLRHTPKLVPNRSRHLEADVAPRGNDAIGG